MGTYGSLPKSAKDSVGSNPKSFRGWTLEVLNIVRRMVSEGRAPRDPNMSGQSGTRITRPSDSFTTAEVYAFERKLEKLHPDGRHIKDKIRQQLQVVEERGVHAASSSKPPATLKRTEVRAPSELASQARHQMDALNQEFALRNVVTTAEVYVFEREWEMLHPDDSDNHREQAGMCGTTP